MPGVTDLPARVLAAIREHDLLRPGDTVLVAVSGGADSMVLLDVLRRLAAGEAWTLHVAHFNHQLRGRASRADEALVRRTARRLGLPCRVGRGNVRTLARQRGLSVEMAARELRHAFLAAAARAAGAEKIALAHHADDQVETFFLRALRGSGSDGLAGMRWKAPSPADPTRQLIRPLLAETRASVRAYARAAGVAFREDLSNRRAETVRNVLRRRVVPVLRRLQPALAVTVPRLMSGLADEADFLLGLARQWLARRRPAFGRLHPALQRRVLQLQLRALGVEPEFDLIERLRTAPDRPVTAPGGGVVRRTSSGEVRLEPPAAPAFAGGELRLDLGAGAGAAEFAGVRFHWRLRPRRPGRPPRLPSRPGREWLDADRVGASVVLRHWRPGDRFQPLGLPAPTKLQDLFTNAKVPRAERHRRIVAARADGLVFWVEGFRPGEAVRVMPATRRVLEWRWERPAETAGTGTREGGPGGTVAPASSAW